MLLSFTSTPTGLTLSLNGTNATTPFNKTVIQNSVNGLTAPTPQTIASGTYDFSSWSDGGARVHSITATATATCRRRTPSASSMLAVPIVVDAGGASAVIAPSPVRISFRGADGRTVLAQVANRRPSPLTEPTTVDPEPQGVDAEPETTLYSPLTFTVGQERIEQFPGGGPFVGDLMSAERSGVQYAARRVLSVRRIGAGVRLVVSTNDPSGGGWSCGSGRRAAGRSACPCGRRRAPA